jgi:hypothetical protein
MEQLGSELEERIGYWQGQASSAVASCRFATNLAACPDSTSGTAKFLISAYDQLFQIGKALRVSKSDLQDRPVSIHPVPPAEGGRWVPGFIPDFPAGFGDPSRGSAHPAR